MDSSDTSLASSVHDIPEFEKQCYYFDIRGEGCLGPKLIYRTSKDIFTPPTGPENYTRPIRLLQVDDHAQLDKDDLWSTVRDKVGELLDKRQIPFTSIDLVRFGWEESGVDGRVNEVISGVTIWVGVQEDNTTSDVAFESSQDILGLLKQHGIDDVDVAFQMQKYCSDPKRRIIGHVVWAPPLTGNTPPHGYTQDVCVIKLNKDRFWPNFVHNALSLGVEIDPGAFMSMMMCDGRVGASHFRYPVDRHLFKLRGILTAEQISHPTGKDSDDTPVRFVIKNGHSTGTTIGRLNRFESKVRKYDLTGTFDSTAAPVLPYGKNKHFGAFSGGGDSGSIVAGPKGEFVSLLTGGTGPPESVDITYTTPMYWLWDEVILAKFPVPSYASTRTRFVSSSCLMPSYP
ncbi:hypothetical protein C8T65DRAFT_740514 [Cerioporus squamosus]|nr:hypothetical protein C8T65DRAFT_740514 [Cerioporus squamosus]